MTNFTKYKAILWDFDGVIMDSMPIRDKGFEVTLANYPEGEVKSLLEYHRINGGLSRYVKFRYFFEKIRNVSVTDEQIAALASKFSDVMMELLLDEKLLIMDSVEFIRQNYKAIPMHVVSGSDGVELRKICDALNLSQYFGSIHGSPTPKKQLISILLADYNYTPESVVLIGDSINDYEAAVHNNISFWGYRNLSLQEKSETYIDSFSKQ